MAKLRRERQALQAALQNHTSAQPDNDTEKKARASPDCMPQRAGSVQTKRRGADERRRRRQTRCAHVYKETATTVCAVTRASLRVHVPCRACVSEALEWNGIEWNGME